MSDIKSVKPILKQIKSFLYASSKCSSRCESYLDDLLSIIFCKLMDEERIETGLPSCFYFSEGKDPSELRKRINDLYEIASLRYGKIPPKPLLLLHDDRMLAYIIQLLQESRLSGFKPTIVADLYQYFMPHSSKGSSGQFFTPQNVLEAAVKILHPKDDDKIIDPACGAGGFLAACTSFMSGASNSNQSYRLFGIDKDSYICSTAAYNLALQTKEVCPIFCEDSLDTPSSWSSACQKHILPGSFDIVFANPPFGSRIPIVGSEVLRQYSFGCSWVNKKDMGWIKGNLKESEAPQVLFIERCLQLLKEGGKLAIILPDGILSNPTEGYIRQELLKSVELLAVIDLPLDTFLPYTSMKTHLLIMTKVLPKPDYHMFMSYPKGCGHDKRGKEAKDDDISGIPAQYGAYLQNSGSIDSSSADCLAFSMRRSQLIDDILLVKYYIPQLDSILRKANLNDKYRLVSIKELVQKGIIRIFKGHEVGSDAYGKGSIPFIRTSEICNWEIALDPTHCVSEDIYEKFRYKQKVENEDILIINDGTYLIGKEAMITELDTRMVFQSHFRKLTVLDKDYISPYLLLGLLGMEIVQRQIESKSFRQGTISTLGNRLLEVFLPIPVDKAERVYIDRLIRDIIKLKKDARKKAQSCRTSLGYEQLMGKPGRGSVGNL